jgi:hypothetical protein
LPTIVVQPWVEKWAQGLSAMKIEADWSGSQTEGFSAVLWLGLSVFYSFPSLTLGQGRRVVKTKVEPVMLGELGLRKVMQALD